jgi:hypothetical protein
MLLFFFYETNYMIFDMMLGKKAKDDEKDKGFPD